MRERGRYQLQLMKTRSSSGVGQKIDLEFNIDNLRITDVDEDEGSSTPQSAGSALLNSIKSRSTVDKETGEIMPAGSAPKVKANIESSKLRQLINNLPTDEL